MLRIRLSRVGKKRQPSYRVVVTDIEAKRDGRIVERIGHYDPRSKAQEYSIQEDRALYWLSVGAQPSDAVRRLLEKQGTYGRLGRLHGGESFETLVAEYQGAELPQVAVGAGDVSAEVATMAEDMADMEAAAAVAAVAEMTGAMAVDEVDEADEAGVSGETAEEE
jgi:small subunit ribosomal protein S16